MGSIYTDYSECRVSWNTLFGCYKLQSKMTTMPQASPTLCSTTNDDGILSPFMTESNMEILVFVLIGATLLFCCASCVLCTVVCMLCRRRKRPRTGDVQDQSKSNGYMMPVVKEEDKEMEDVLHRSSTNTFTQNLITNEDVQRDMVEQQQNAMVTPVTQETEWVVPMNTTTVANNPLYIKHSNMDNNPSYIKHCDEDNDDDDTDYNEILLPEVSQEQRVTILNKENNTTEAIAENSQTTEDDLDKYDYENKESIKAAEFLHRQGIPLPIPPATGIPLTPTTPNGTKSNRTPSNSSKQGPPETKPKPKHPKQRNPSTQSSTSVHNEVFVSPPDTATTDNDEPHYMTPRPANQIPWQMYKELDFSTVDPTTEYVVPNKEFFEN